MKQNRVVMLLLVALGVSVLAGGCGPAAAKRKPWIEAPPEMRIGAARQLVLARDPMSAQSLVLALDDPEPKVRRLAIYGLERIGDQENARKDEDQRRGGDAEELPRVGFALFVERVGKDRDERRRKRTFTEEPSEHVGHAPGGAEDVPD